MTTFTVNGPDLHEAATWASRAVPNRPSQPVLAGLMLDVSDDLHISGYDFETHATAIIPAEVDEPGQILVSAQLVTAITKTVGRNPLTVTATGGAVEVRAGNAEWTLPTLPIVEYPQLPGLPGDSAGEVNVAELRGALAKVLPVVSRAPQPVFLTGVKLESSGDQLTLVGTDRFRLAVATIPWFPTSGADLDVLVPAGLLDVAMRAAGDDGETMAICEGSAGVAFATETRIVTGRHLAEQFVSWRRVMPAEIGHHAVVDAADLGTAIRQALVAGRDGQLLLSFTGGEVVVRGTGDGMRGQASAAAELVGDPITVKVNSAFLSAGVDLPGSDRVTVHFGDNPNKPLLMVGDDPGYRHVVTPVRLTDADRAVAA